MSCFFPPIERHEPQTGSVRLIVLDVMRGWAQLGPLQWLRCVHKQVKVKAGRDEELRGWLLTVDPVSARCVV